MLVRDETQLLQIKIAFHTLFLHKYLHKGRHRANARCLSFFSSIKKTSQPKSPHLAELYKSKSAGLPTFCILHYAFYI